MEWGVWCALATCGTSASRMLAEQVRVSACVDLPHRKGAPREQVFFLGVRRLLVIWIRVSGSGTVTHCPVF